MSDRTVNVDELRHESSPRADLTTYQTIAQSIHADNIARCAVNIANANGAASTDAVVIDEAGKLKIPYPCDKRDLKADTNMIGYKLNHADSNGAAELLSLDLKSAPDQEQYNKILLDSQTKAQEMQGDDVFGRAYLRTEDWNNDTGTWNKVYIAERFFPDTPPMRIVQPGNTLSEIAQDRLNEMKPLGPHFYDKLTRSELQKAIVVKNEIANPDKILTGQVVKLPYDAELPGF